MKLDAKRREYNITVIGEESHPAYNRVGLTSFFQHRKVENLYLKPHGWVGRVAISPAIWLLLTPPVSEHTSRLAQLIFGYESH
jgi:hypothetical protein